MPKKLIPEDIFFYYDEPQAFWCTCEDGKLYLCLRDDTVYPEYITVETNEQEVEDIKSEKIDYLPLIEERSPRYRSTWIESDLILCTHLCNKVEDSKTSEMNKYKPKTKEELIEYIRTELELRQGPSADLNHIDVSEITDMSGLFMFLDIESIKIDKWNTSNVTRMSYMFAGCSKFQADISGWDTSKVVSMGSMFYRCTNFKCNLSKWSVSKVIDSFYTFEGCPGMKNDPSLQPKFKQKL